MAASEIVASTRHIGKGITKVYWVETIASFGAPTLAELNAGTDLSPQVMELEGFNVTGETVETPNFKDTFTPTIPGSTTADDSSLTMYADKGGNDVRGVLARGDSGYIVIFPGGVVTGYKMSVFPVRVTSVSITTSVDDEPVTVNVGFAITEEPAEHLAVPA